jgi:protein ImuB
MSAGNAQGMAPGLQLARDDAQARQRQLEGLALAMLQYTPTVACVCGQAVLLEVQASLSLYKGASALCRHIRATLRAMHVRAVMGMAPSALGAWALSTQVRGRKRVLTMRSLAKRLDSLPISILPGAQAHADWLDGIGCRSLQQLRSLPRKALQQRTGLLLMRDVDAAYGLRPHDFPWFEPSDVFSSRLELMEHLEHTGAILAAATHLIEQLCGWLRARQMAVSSLDLLMHHEKGRHACPPTRIVVKLSENAWEPGEFVHVLQEQLHRVVLDAPVIGLSLDASQPVSRVTSSGGLFPEPEQCQRQEHRLLDLLRARLGEHCVRISQPMASHLPEEANQWVALGQREDRHGVHALPPRFAAQSRPFWLLKQPVALGLRGNNPVYRNAVLRLLQGPERLESGWWDEAGHRQRDYFVAQAPQGARYWIYRAREASGTGWYLHGLFG